MNTLVENRVREIAGKILKVTCEINQADHIDVKVFVGHIDAARYRNNLVEISRLYDELTSIEELQAVLTSGDYELNSVADYAEIAMIEYCDLMHELQQDVACKLEGRSRNTHYTAEENYNIAKWFNDGFAAKSGIDLYKEYMDALHAEAIAHNEYLDRYPEEKTNALLEDVEKAFCFFD